MLLHKLSINAYKLVFKMMVAMVSITAIDCNLKFSGGLQSFLVISQRRFISNIKVTNLLYFLSEYKTRYIVSGVILTFIRGQDNNLNLKSISIKRISMKYE